MSNKAYIGFAWVKDRGEALKTAMAYVESRMIPAKVQKDLEDCFYQIPSVRARYYCDKKVPYSQRNMQMENLADMANVNRIADMLDSMGFDAVTGYFNPEYRIFRP